LRINEINVIESCQQFICLSKKEKERKRERERDVFKHLTYSSNSSFVFIMFAERVTGSGQIAGERQQISNWRNCFLLSVCQPAAARRATAS
jgi:hypothetical protein